MDARGKYLITYNHCSPLKIEISLAETFGGAEVSRVSHSFSNAQVMFTRLDQNFNSFRLSARFLSDTVSFENESTLHHALFIVNKELFHCCSINQNGYLIKHYVSHYRTLLWFHDFLFKAIGSQALLTIFCLTS